MYINYLHLFSENYEIIDGIEIPYDRDREMFPESEIRDGIYLIKGFRVAYNIVGNISWEDIKSWILN